MGALMDEPETRLRDRRLGGWAGFALIAALAAGCGHKQTTASVPVPASAPPAQTTTATQPSASSAPATPAGAAIPAAAASSMRIPVLELPAGGVSDDDREFILSHRPISSEQGGATWYTAPYKGKKAANGQVFRDDALTAAHRTLPMGSLIVVTNLTTRQASAMRVSDRGPFVPDKVIDLTIASAKAIGIYRAGTAPVRIDVYETPKPMETGGRWCVQIGAFKSEERAQKMKAALLRAYPDANVIEFPGEASYWVRIRPVGDNREEAERIVRRVRPTQGDAYLTRLD
jgi:rare lipoprotein A